MRLWSLFITNTNINNSLSVLICKENICIFSAEYCSMFYLLIIDLKLNISKSLDLFAISFLCLFLINCKAI